MLLADLWSVRIVKNCDVGLKNASLGLRPRPQFFFIRTSQPANNIYMCYTFPPGKGYFQNNSLSNSPGHHATQAISKNTSYIERGPMRLKIVSKVFRLLCFAKRCHS